MVGTRLIITAVDAELATLAASEFCGNASSVIGCDAEAGLECQLAAAETPDGRPGVAVLAESHISVHTWPELDYAAFDVFMCGECRPDKAVAVLERMFSPQRAEITEQRRGLVE